MRRILFSFAIAGALAAMPAPALAAPSAAVVYQAGQCIVQRDRRAAAALMRSLPLTGGTADLGALAAGRARDCAAGMAEAPAMLVRGAIAQALFLRDFRVGREPRDTDHMVNLNLPVEGWPRGTSPTQLFGWADCVVRNDAAGTRALLESEVGSPGEAAAISGLQPFMSACTRPDARFSIRSSELRSIFAQSAYFALYRYWTGQLQGTGGRPGGD